MVTVTPIEEWQPSRRSESGNRHADRGPAKMDPVSVPVNPAVDTTHIGACPDYPGMTDYTTVSIPKDLAERVEETIEGTSFSSTSDLVRFLLRSIVIQHQKQGQLTEAEFEEITAQLRDLGYIE